MSSKDRERDRFTGGIGENAVPVRAAVCRNAAWLGLELDADANASHGPRISRPGSRVSAWVVPTNEELMIARHCQAVVGPPKTGWAGLAARLIEQSGQ
jgi:acetate kinase